MTRARAYMSEKYKLQGAALSRRSAPKPVGRLLSFCKSEQFCTDAIDGQAHIFGGRPILGGSLDVVLCPDVAACMDSRFDCGDLLQRSVIHYGAERKASSAIISAPIQGVNNRNCCECISR